MNVRKVLFFVAVCVGIVAAVGWVTRLIWTPVVTFRGHNGLVFGGVISPDGKTLASVSQDKTIKLWDVASRKERLTIRAEGDVGSSSGMAFSPDGKTLAAAIGRCHTIQILDVATGKQRVTLQGHTDYVCCVVFSPDGTLLASGSFDQTLRLWDVASGEERVAIKGHNSWVKCVAFSRDGTSLVSGSSDETIKLWDVATGTARATLQGHGYYIECVAFGPDGETLASGDFAGRVKLWDVATGRNTATFDGHEDSMGEVVFSSDGKTVATLGAIDDTINLWNVASAQRIDRFENVHHRPRPRLFRFIHDQFADFDSDNHKIVRSISFNPDGNIVALGCDTRDDTAVKMWTLPVRPR